MKYIGMITLMIFVSTAHAQMMGSGSTTTERMNNSTSTTTGSTNNVRENSVRSDSVGTGQSSTVRPTQNQMNRNVAPLNQGTRATDPAYCVDSTGKSLSKTDNGFRSCINKMYGK